MIVPDLGIERDDHDAALRNTDHLREAGVDVAPMMEGEDRHRRIERVVGKRQILGAGPDGWGGVESPLGDHDLGRLDGGYLTVKELVRARAGPDIDDASRVAEGLPDRFRQPRVRLPDGSIGAAMRSYSGPEPIERRYHRDPEIRTPTALWSAGFGADRERVTSRFYLTIGLTIAAVAVGGWKFVLPVSSDSQKQVEQGVTNVLNTITSAEFTGAQATLEVQRSSTGSYAGAPVTAPITLAFADAASYCIQVVQGTVALHLSGPGGTAVAGHCPTP